MTALQYKAALDELGLYDSQGKLAYFLGIGPRTSQGYALGESPVPEPIAVLLLLMVKYKLRPKQVNARCIMQKPITTLLRLMVKHKLTPENVLNLEDVLNWIEGK